MGNPKEIQWKLSSNSPASSSASASSSSTSSSRARERPKKKIITLTLFDITIRESVTPEHRYIWSQNKEEAKKTFSEDNSTNSDNVDIKKCQDENRKINVSFVTDSAQISLPIEKEIFDKKHAAYEAIKQIKKENIDLIKFEALKDIAQSEITHINSKTTTVHGVKTSACEQINAAINASFDQLYNALNAQHMQSLLSEEAKRKLQKIADEKKQIDIAKNIIAQLRKNQNSLSGANLLEVNSIIDDIEGAILNSNISQLQSLYKKPHIKRILKDLNTATSDKGKGKKLSPHCPHRRRAKSLPSNSGAKATEKTSQKNSTAQYDKTLIAKAFSQYLTNNFSTKGIDGIFDRKMPHGCECMQVFIDTLIGGPNKVYEPKDLNTSDNEQKVIEHLKHVANQKNSNSSPFYCFFPIPLPSFFSFRKRETQDLYNEIAKIDHLADLLTIGDVQNIYDKLHNEEATSTHSLS